MSQKVFDKSLKGTMIKEKVLLLAVVYLRQRHVFR